MSVDQSVPSRRTLLLAGGGTAAVSLLAACGGATGGDSKSTVTLTAGSKLATVSDIPDGGALVVGQVVLARSGKTVTAHSAICTHQGCLVVAGAGNEVDCPCHGSQFTASTGAVLQGPAAVNLPAVKVTVKNGTVIWTG